MHRGHAVRGRKRYNREEHSRMFKPCKQTFNLAKGVESNWQIMQLKHSVRWRLWCTNGSIDEIAAQQPIASKTIDRPIKGTLRPVEGSESGGIGSWYWSSFPGRMLITRVVDSKCFLLTSLTIYGLGQARRKKPGAIWLSALSRCD